MKNLIDWFGKHLLEVMLVFFLVYTTMPILSPVLLKLGLDDAGMAIQNIYRIFCHQRVERSAFLFGENGLVSFYTLDELKNMGEIPEHNPYVPDFIDTTIYNYPYVGNEKIGYKVAFCIRDTALYISLSLTAMIFLYFVKKKKWNGKVSWLVIISLLLPMAIDGVFQTICEIFTIPWIPEAYIDNVPKRIITGALFGIGFALFVFSQLKKALEE